MLFEELQVEITDSSDVEFLDSDRTRTPAWLIRLAYAARAGSESLAEYRNLCKWFGVERRRATIHHWYQAYAYHYDQNFTAKPYRVAVDEKQIQLENEQKAWLYAAIDGDTKVVLHTRLSWHTGRDPAEQFLDELKERHRVSDAEFLVDEMGISPRLHALISAVSSAILTATSLRSSFRHIPCEFNASTKLGIAVRPAPSAG